MPLTHATVPRRAFSNSAINSAFFGKSAGLSFLAVSFLKRSANPAGSSGIAPGLIELTALVSATMRWPICHAGWFAPAPAA